MYLKKICLIYTYHIYTYLIYAQNPPILEEQKKMHVTYTLSEHIWTYQSIPLSSFIQTHCYWRNYNELATVSWIR